MNKVIMLAVLFGLCFSPGCSRKTDAESITITSHKIEAVTSGAVTFGLTQFAKKDPEKVKQVAQLIKDNIDQTVLPYLQGSAGVASTVVEAHVIAEFISQLPPDISDLIAVASGILDAYIPAPGPDQYMKPDQLAYLISFFKGVSAGSTKFLAGARADIAPKVLGDRTNKWFRACLSTDPRK